MRYQYKKYVITQTSTWITLIQSLKWGLLNKRNGEESGFIGVDSARGRARDSNSVEDDAAPEKDDRELDGIYVI